MKRILWCLGLVDLVWVKYYGGEVVLRVVRDGPSGERAVCGIVKSRIGILEPDGTISGGKYMTEWVSYRPFENPFPVYPIAWRKK